MKSAAMRAAKSHVVPNADLPLIAEPSPQPGATREIAGTVAKPLSVSQVNAFLQRLLSICLPPTFCVYGEISNFRTYDRGHAFFTLKDASAELPCVLWKDDLARLKFRPGDGMAVIARGAIRLYEAQGRLQLYVETLLPQGTGALELAYRQLCEKLRAEGLFDSARKRPIPRLPRRLAIITSRTGDVLHDVLTTAWRRFPGLHILLCPVRVQGENAVPDIISAIQLVNNYQKQLLAAPLAAPRSPGDSAPCAIDLIMLVRGGGSLEDLWAFNDESLARAIVASAIPVATGIGHEPDITVADLVGDLRGPTPTGIAELTIPDARALRADLDAQAAILSRDLAAILSLATHQLERAADRLVGQLIAALRDRQTRLEFLSRQVERIEPRHAIAQGWRRVEDAQRRLAGAATVRLHRQSDALTLAAHRLERASPRPLIARQRDRLAHLQRGLDHALRARLAASARTLTFLHDQLRMVSPQATLERGYSITTLKDGAIVRSADQVKKGDILTTRLADGQITSTVGKPRQESLF